METDIYRIKLLSILTKITEDTQPFLDAKDSQGLNASIWECIFTELPSFQNAYENHYKQIPFNPVTADNRENMFHKSILNYNSIIHVCFNALSLNTDAGYKKMEYDIGALFYRRIDF